MNNYTNTENKVRRPRIALITNHGYAGINIPVGGAPDTGGQNFYVNSKAQALEELGMDVTIFTRGGFPFFKSEVIREGIENLSDHIRYVYVPGGGDMFIHKEDIAPALTEETKWLDDFISAEAAAEGIRPEDYYECFDTHYWDAAVIGVLLIERWHDKIAYDFIKDCSDGVLASGLTPFEGDTKHKLSMSTEVELHLGHIAKKIYKGKTSAQILEILCPYASDSYPLTYTKTNPFPYKDIKEATLLGKALLDNLNINGLKLYELLHNANRHIWTPHSTSIIKERNYWDKKPSSVRWLKFIERNSHEEFICKHTRLFCSTSPEIWQNLYCYQKQRTEQIFNYPPCLDTELFKPRTKDELKDVYEFLSSKSGIDVSTLKNSKIIFESSRMDKTKRKDILLKAFSKFVDKTEKTFLFIGGGPNTSEVFKDLEATLESLENIKNKAFLLGFIPSDIISEIFSVPDLFVSASEMEGFGMSVSQAAAAKVAVVSSDLIPFSTQFAPDAAEIVKAGDIDAFAASMLELLENDKKRAENAQKLYDIALELNWVNTSKKYIEWYHEKFGFNSPQ
ncbi:MAG: glycosyltransferase [Deltaproteobacteria bacterium]|nr:glycosyltransferase [Deltaproteobacteria bacterium]